MARMRGWTASALLVSLVVVSSTWACTASSDLNRRLVAKLLLDVQDNLLPQLTVLDLWTLPMTSFESAVDVRPQEGQTQGHMVFLDPGTPEERPLDAARIVSFVYKGGNRVEHEGEDCTLHQVLFRAPSHHRVMGTEFPLEMIVLATCEADDEQNRRIAASFLFEEGPESDTLRSFAGNPAASTTATAGEISIDTSSWTSFGADYYHYLRQHPAVVDHLLCTETNTASAAQIAALKKAVGRNVWLVENVD